jgi:hypothetical protein
MEIRAGAHTNPPKRGLQRWYDEGSFTCTTVRETESPNINLLEFMLQQFETGHAGVLMQCVMVILELLMHRCVKNTRNQLIYEDNHACAIAVIAGV